MGQQQLIGLLLTAIIVGVAIMLGIALFAQESRTAERDEMHVRLLDVVGHAQQWYKRPSMLGGGGRSFQQISWPVLNVDPNTVSAMLKMADKQAGSFRLTAVSRNDTTFSISYMVYADSLALQ